MKQLYYYLPEQNRTLTPNGLAAEVELIGREYSSSWIIGDMVDAGLAIVIDENDPRIAVLEDETRTILIAELFYAMSNNLEVMAEFADDDDALLDELTSSDDEILESYRQTFLDEQDV